MNNQHTIDGPCENCGETHKPMTPEMVESAKKKVERRYRLLAIVYILLGLGIAASVAMFDKWLGLGVFLYELLRIVHVNLAVASDGRDQLRQVLAYLKGTPKKNDNATSIVAGQYL